MEQVSSMVEQVRERAETLLAAHVIPAVRSLWNNPLLSHARRAKPLPTTALKVILPAIAGVLTVAAVIAWVAGVRALGAAIAALSLGAVIVPVFFAPVAGADRVARQMRFSRQDPRRLTDLPPEEVTLGLALVTLWKLRWPLLVAVALTPALIISVLRLDIIDYTAWRDSAAVLGEAAAGGRAASLLADGRIPTLRLLIRALGAGLLPWALLPPFAVMGISFALGLRDGSLSPLAALLTTVVLSVLMAGVWQLVTRTGLMAGILEVLRFLVVLAMAAGLGWGALRLNALNARWLTDPPDIGTIRRREPSLSSESDAASGQNAQPSPEKSP